MIGPRGQLLDLGNEKRRHRNIVCIGELGGWCCFILKGSCLSVSLFHVTGGRRSGTRWVSRNCLHHTTKAAFTLPVLTPGPEAGPHNCLPCQCQLIKAPHNPEAGRVSLFFTRKVASCLVSTEHSQQITNGSSNRRLDAVTVQLSVQGRHWLRTACRLAWMITMT